MGTEVIANTIGCGYEVSISSNSLQSTGCLGLMIRMEDGTDAITTVTHGFNNPFASFDPKGI